LFPFACPQTALLFALMIYLLSGQLSVITGTTSGVTVSLDITYRWDAAANLVNPFVTVTGSTGTISVAPLGQQGVLAEWIEAIVASVGNQMNAWVPLMAQAIATALEQALRANGLNSPLAAAQWGMTAVSGGAHSASSESLTLFAEV